MAPLPPEPAGPRHADLLAALHADCRAIDDEPWDRQAMADLLNAPGTFAFVAAERSGEPVGLVIARSAGGEAEILTIGVLPDRRRRGYGAALVGAAARRAAELGGEALFLEVAADNMAAQALYRRAGFRSSGRRHGYYRREPAAVDALLFRRDLDPGQTVRIPAPR